MVCFLHRVLRRLLPRRVLLKGDDWDNLMCFVFLGKNFLKNVQFMLRTSFLDRALSVVKQPIDVKKKKGESGSCSAAFVVMSASYKPFLIHVVSFFRESVKSNCSTLPGSQTLKLGWLVLCFLFCLSCRKANAFNVSNSCLRVSAIGNGLGKRIGVV